LSSQDFPQISYPPQAVNGKGSSFSLAGSLQTRHRYWLNGLLFFLTLVTTSVVGAGFLYNFQHNRPPIDVTHDLIIYAQLFREPLMLLNGLAFSLTLLLIILAHELGHYLTCVYYRLDASLPYFLPAPTIIGTLGAFIRIRSPIYSKRVLFDVGIAGPVAGFVFLLPALIVGLAYSKVVPGISQQGDLIFGTPALLRLLEYLMFPGVNPADIALHPMARAAWVGILATALNLLPIGQLDGGHILYAFFGDRHRMLSRVFVAALVPMGLIYWPWLLWAALLFFFGLRHPVVYDMSELGPARKKLGWLALIIFVLCFMVAPVETAGNL
jgi:membrane-associated protease RseP (regulator of RpoE activity)